MAFCNFLIFDYLLSYFLLPVRNVTSSLRRNLFKLFFFSNVSFFKFLTTISSAKEGVCKI